MHYTKNTVNVKSLPCYDVYISVYKMVCFTVFLEQWLNALKKYFAAA